MLEHPADRLADDLFVIGHEDALSFEKRIHFPDAAAPAEDSISRGGDVFDARPDPVDILDDRRQPAPEVVVADVFLHQHARLGDDIVQRAGDLVGDVVGGLNLTDKSVRSQGVGKSD